MEQNNKKILTVSYLVAGGLTALVLTILIETFSATFGWVARLMANDLLSHGLPVAIGVAVFFVLQFHKGMNVWADDVVTEIKKVVWPSRKDTVMMTVAVCVMILISAVMLGVFDKASSFLLTKIVSK